MRKHLVLVSSMGLAVGVLGACGDATTDGPDAGVQQYTCGPSNCTGCCYGNVCQSGVTVAGCGKGGQACVACVKGQVCNNTQACAIDPESVWYVQAVSTKIRATDDGRPWTSDGGTPDFYLDLKCPGASTPSRVSGLIYSSGPADVVSWSGACETTGRNLLHSFAMATLQQTNSPYSSPSSPHIVGSIFHSFTEAEVLDGGTVTIPNESSTSGMESTTLSVKQQ